MNRIQLVTPEEASAEVKKIYGDLHKKLGKVPNIFLNMGNSAAALQAFVQLSECVNKTSLSPDLREKLALAIAETNKCHYCLSAHSVFAKGAGIDEKSIMAARKGESNDSKTTAILRFAKLVAQNRGHVSDSDVAAVKNAGVSNHEIADLFVVIALNMFTNMFNEATKTPLDFPQAAQLP